MEEAVAVALARAVEEAVASPARVRPAATLETEEDSGA